MNNDFLIGANVEEFTATEGTGTLTLSGPSSDRRGFASAFAAGTGVGRCFYCINWGPHWEYGLGTVTDGSPDTLSRDIVLGSSANGAKLSLGPGTKIVFCEIPPDFQFACGAKTFNDQDTSPSVLGNRLFIAANSAATTITTFDDGVPGQEIIIIATNGNTTINHGSLIRHPAAGNLTLGANDVARYVMGRSASDGLVWQRLSYSDNA